MLLPCIDGQGLKLYIYILPFCDHADGEPGACRTSATEVTQIGL